jgi:hypothetical protein
MSFKFKLSVPGVSCGPGRAAMAEDGSGGSAFCCSGRDRLVAAMRVKGCFPPRAAPPANATTAASCRSGCAPWSGVLKCAVISMFVVAPSPASASLRGANSPTSNLLNAELSRTCSTLRSATGLIGDPGAGSGSD